MIAGLILASGVILLVFGLWPQMDLVVAGYFYDGTRFALDQNAFITRLRFLVWDASLVVPLLALIMLGLTLWRGALVLTAKAWGYILALFLLGPGILVNAILKAHWGRARPYSISDFGGSAHFTPAYQISDQCAANCSFVSGEGAGAMALAISILLILFVWRDRMPRAALRGAQAATLAMLVFTGWQRVASGGHFLSDVLLSWLFVALVAVVLARLMRPLAPPRP